MHFGLSQKSAFRFTQQEPTEQIPTYQGRSPTKPIMVPKKRCILFQCRVHMTCSTLLLPLSSNIFAHSASSPSPCYQGGNIGKEMHKHCKSACGLCVVSCMSSNKILKQLCAWILFTNSLYMQSSFTKMNHCYRKPSVTALRSLDSTLCSLDMFSSSNCKCECLSALWDTPNGSQLWSRYFKAGRNFW